jgi:EAL domain-containing protein (putative c-di-GMP-specific phosphodiesterase class I)
VTDDDTTKPPPSNVLSQAPSAQPSDQPDSGPLEAQDSLLALMSFVQPGDLSVVFQPIVDLGTGKTFSYEALVRCSLPEFRAPPKLFDRAVEQRCTGRLGRMIREIGVPLASGIPLFVNIHPRELAEGWLVRPDDPIFVHDDAIYLEVTESVPLTHYDLCMGVLKEVCTRGGVYLVVDDFGAGYSNIKRISDLEPKVVKLDRQLVVGIDKNRRQRELVSAVCDLCQRLGAKVVAEGIETVDEYLALTDTGANYGQGYLFARPGFPLPEVVWPPRAEGDPGPASPHTLRSS